MTVGCQFPGNNFEYVPFDSPCSLHDMDIVLFEVGLGDFVCESDWRAGRRVFHEADVVPVVRSLEHWHAELADAANAGVLIIVFLTEPEDFCSETEEAEVLEAHSSYDALPFALEVLGKEGHGVRLIYEGSVLSRYWEELESFSTYQAFVDGDFSARLATTKSGNKTVGAGRSDARSMLLLPALNIDIDTHANSYEVEDYLVWTAEALQLGERLAAALAELHATLGGSESTTPAPEWALDPAFSSGRERLLRHQVAELAQAVAELEEKRSELEASVA